MRNKQFIICLAALLLTGCAAHRGVCIVERTTHDTLYINTLHYDSVYIYDGVNIHPTTLSSDTCLVQPCVEKTHIEYRYRLLRDTIRIAKVDTIPVVHEVEVVRRERYVPSIYKWSLGICIILVGALCAFCVLKIIRV